MADASDLPTDSSPPAPQAPAPRERARYHHGDLAHALLGAVRELVERDGADRMSVSKACRMAGVSTAAPYKHFADRNDILRSLCDIGFDELRAAMQAAHDGVADPGEARVAEIGKAYVAFAAANPGLFRVMFGMKRELISPSDEDYGLEAKACFQVVIGDVAEASGLEPGSEPAMRLAIMLWTFVHGVSTLLIDGDYEVTEVPVNTDALVEAAARGLLQGGPPRAG
ncbi:TetR/AcrR family transcriptional regulator [Albimonas pacifica]|uniref:Transcriptional regulator, TetR family n=1 Tax=Albimonas pacifica TaxID=1114924 RepID=A0A1I3HQG9_9RHOB|nr:TetR-like C-terminal domain-containing protein [Albimonas pacifica]SFI37975.1 transcriptional regulator, TetR family [Albimonas pacifica]